MIIEVDKIKILIVEDEQVIALHLQRLLKKDGYVNVEIAASGEEALEIYKEKDSNLLLIDINLNGDMTGIEVVKKIKEQNPIAVIYLTSITDNHVIKEATNTQPIAFLNKPFNELQLRTTIEVSLERFLDEKKKEKALKKEINLKEINISELTETNSHLITATWRERELKDELQKTKVLVEEQNRKILDSIEYAKRIQKAIIPNTEELEGLLGDYFMFYKPKDVVSGDFPWAYEVDDYVYIAVVDCTGHGVPGAMMSLIGDLLLNDIVNNCLTDDKTPGQILNELHLLVVKTLKQDAPDSKAADGMDVALCRIKKDKSEIIYAGAHRPLFLVRDGELIEYKGSKFPIGGTQYGGKNNFTDQKIEVQENDAIYFFSDGLPDQFGGPNKLKIGNRRIKRVILENKDEPMQKMEQVFADLFNNWMKEGDEMQIDDVLLIGMKF